MVGARRALRKTGVQAVMKRACRLPRLHHHDHHPVSASESSSASFVFLSRSRRMGGLCRRRDQRGLNLRHRLRSAAAAASRCSLPVAPFENRGPRQILPACTGPELPPPPPPPPKISLPNARFAPWGCSEGLRFRDLGGFDWRCCR